MLDEDDADYSELLRLTKQLIRSFKDQTIPNVMHIEFYKNETGDFIFGEMAARRGGGLIKQELTAAYGMDRVRPISYWNLALSMRIPTSHDYPNMAYCWKPLD